MGYERIEFDKAEAKKIYDDYVCCNGGSQNIHDTRTFPNFWNALSARVQREKGYTTTWYVEPQVSRELVEAVDRETHLWMVDKMGWTWNDGERKFYKRVANMPLEQAYNDSRILALNAFVKCGMAILLRPADFAEDKKPLLNAVAKRRKESL